MTVNRKYKNNVFTSLFNNEDLLRELYCALEGVSLPPDTPVLINSLENVLIQDFNNDISFEIGGKLVILMEHQSTLSPNIALRLLLYISRILEKKIDSRTIYSRKEIKIPWPEFFVLYNGIEPFPDNKIVKLSDLYEEIINIGLPEKKIPLLDLTVRIININEGKNKEIVNQCRKLQEYSFFIAKIRELKDQLGSLELAVKESILYCRNHDILEEYLETHGSELLNMILTEWNTEDSIAFARNEGREEGLETGIKEGRDQGHTEGIKEGIETGIKEGILQTAYNLKAAGVSPEIIYKTTGLNLEET